MGGLDEEGDLIFGVWESKEYGEYVEEFGS